MVATLKSELNVQVMVLKEKLGKSENENVNFKTEEHETAVEEEKPKSTVVCKQEEICSTNSVVMDSDVLQNLNMQKIDRKGNSRGFGFLEEDTDLWSWNYWSDYDNIVIKIILCVFNLFAELQ